MEELNPRIVPKSVVFDTHNLWSKSSWKSEELPPENFTGLLDLSNTPLSVTSMRKG
jgi:hypothetical protein